MISSTAPNCFTRRESLAEYLACTDYVSSSAVRRFLRTGRAPALAMIPDAISRDTSLGDAFHALLLEPDRFEEEFVQADRRAPPTVAADESGLMARTWLSSRDCEALQRMHAAVLKYARLPLADWLATGERELSLYWQGASGGRWKGRPDCFSDDIVLEIKTAADVRPARFGKARKRYGYDLQAALYLEGIELLRGHRPRFLYVSVETSRPHTVWIHEPTAHELSAATSELGVARAQFLRGLAAASAGTDPAPADI